MKTEVVYHEHCWRAFVAVFLLSLGLGVAAVRMPAVGAAALLLAILGFVFLLRTTVLILDPARGQVLLMVNRPFRKLRQVCPIGDVALVLQKTAGSRIQSFWFRSGESFRYLLIAGDERVVVPRAEALSRALGRPLRIES